MSTRDDLETFTTPASRALVDQFIADTAGEDNDVDMDEVVQQNLADHEAALTGRQPDQKPARPKHPKPTVGYIVVRPGWDPRNRQDSIDLWVQHPNLKDVQASLDFAGIVKSNRTVVVKVTTTFEIVEDGRG